MLPYWNVQRAWRRSSAPSARRCGRGSVSIRFATIWPSGIAACRRRHFLPQLCSSSDDAIISKTLEGNILTWNAGAEHLFGYSANEAIGRSIMLLIPPERQDEEVTLLKRLGGGERIEHSKRCASAKDGRQIDISLTVSPIRDSNGVIIGASKVARDITQRKQAEQSLRDADRRKDEFLAILATSCETRSPPFAIRSTSCECPISKLPRRDVFMK